MITYNAHITGYLFIMGDGTTPKCLSYGQVSLSQGKLCVLQIPLLLLSEQKQRLLKES